MKVRALMFVVVIGVLTGGCLVQSLDNFYKGSQVVKLPGVEGSWDVVRDFNHVIGTNETVSPWYIDPNVNTQMPIYKVTSDTHKTGLLYVAFFDVGGRTFCDVSAAMSGLSNQYWLASIEQVHTLGLVDLTNDTLRVQLLNRAWFNNAATNGTFNMTWVSRGHKSFLVTEGKPEWKKFLEEHGRDAGLFSTNHVFEFRRAKMEPVAAAKP